MGCASLVVVLALSAVEPSLVPAAAPEVEVPDALRFDEPAPPAPVEDKRAQRFLGALAGGALGLATPLALLPLGDAACFGGPCASPAHVILGALAPLSGVIGAWAGYSLLGGDGGLVTATAALLPGALAAAPLFALAAVTGASATMLTFLPYLLTVGAVFVGAAALALDARSRQLDVLGADTAQVAAPPGRVALVSLTTALAGTIGALGSVLVFASCRDVACAGVGVGVALAASLGTAAAGWGAHVALGGRGSFVAALLGLGIAGAASALTIPFFVAASATPAGFPIANTAGATVLMAVMLGGGVFFPTLALEWSHGASVTQRLEGVQVSAAPVPGGGVMSAALRF